MMANTTLVLGACRTCFRVCDGADFGAGREARRSQWPFSLASRATMPCAKIGPSRRVVARKAGCGAGGAEFTAPSGQSIRIRSVQDAALPAAVETGSTLRETIWGVDHADSLEQFGADLARDREIKADSDGTLHTRDAAGFAVGLRLTKPVPAGVDGAPSRMNRPFDPERRARPTKIGHVVYNVRKGDIEKVSAFYLERLKFRLSDRALGLGDF